MKEIADIIITVLKGSKPGVTDKGTPSKGKVVLDPAAKEKAQKAVSSLLSRFVLYPQLDLDFLKQEFVK